MKLAFRARHSIWPVTETFPVAAIEVCHRIAWGPHGKTDIWYKGHCPPGVRLRDLEVHCAYSEDSVGAQELRIRHVGRRTPSRIRPGFEPQPSEIVATEHWCSSGFANTDLDLQLEKHGIHQLIMIGLIAHTCIEATVRFAAELGYEVTMARDATADYSNEEMHAALDVNLPNYASALVTAPEIVDSLSSLQIRGVMELA